MSGDQPQTNTGPINPERRQDGANENFSKSRKPREQTACCSPLIGNALVSLTSSTPAAANGMPSRQQWVKKWEKTHAFFHV